MSLLCLLQASKDKKRKKKGVQYLDDDESEGHTDSQLLPDEHGHPTWRIVEKLQPPSHSGLDTSSAVVSKNEPPVSKNHQDWSGAVNVSTKLAVKQEMAEDLPGRPVMDADGSQPCIQCVCATIAMDAKTVKDGDQQPIGTTPPPKRHGNNARVAMMQVVTLGCVYTF